MVKRGSRKKRGKTAAGDLNDLLEKNTRAKFRLSSRVADELDLHGKTVEEAIPLVEKFLEVAYSAGTRQVWIVHGKGTGTLRQEIRRRLSKHTLVKSQALADNSHGGDGATRVEIID